MEDEGSSNMTAMAIDNEKASIRCSCDGLKYMGDPLQCCCIVGPAGAACSPLLSLYQVEDRCAGRYLELKETPLKITRGGRAIPAALTHLIDVTHSCHGPVPFQAFNFFPSSFSPLSTKVKTRVDCN